MLGERELAASGIGRPANPKRLIFFVGLNTGYVTRGLPDARLLDFYRRRSSSALHCAIVGNVVIPRGYPTNQSTPVITKSPIWGAVASAISERGSFPGIQLASTWPGYKASRRFVSKESAQAIENAREIASTMTIHAIREAISALFEGAELSLRAGFKHIQIHAAHGYLFNLLIDDRIFAHADEVRDRLSAWSVSFQKKGIETSIRISLRSGNASFDAMGQDDFLDKVSLLPFDFIDLSSGFYSVDKRLIYPARSEMLISRLQQTTDLAMRHSGASFIYSGRAGSLESASLPSNVHIGVCRDLIANQDYLSDPTKRCLNSGKCHYFSRGEDHLTCSQWDMGS